MPAETNQTTLILVRHGESVLNAANRFTGLLDVPLTARGRAEAVHAGQLMRDHHLAPEAAYTSLLTRSIDTAQLILAELVGNPVDIQPRWELNERTTATSPGANAKRSANVSETTPTTPGAAPSPAGHPTSPPPTADTRRTCSPTTPASPSTS